MLQIFHRETESGYTIGINKIFGTEVRTQTSCVKAKYPLHHSRQREMITPCKL